MLREALVTMRQRSVTATPARAPGPAVTVRPRRRGGRPARLDALVLDGDYRQSLAAVRTLARRGLEVGAAACRPVAGWAPALRSRFCSLAAVLPDVAAAEERYADALLGLLDEFPARVVLPSHDGTIERLRARRADVERRAALPLAGETALDVAMSKPRTLALAADLGIAIPRGVLVRDRGDLRAALAEVGYPAVLKPVRSWTERDGLGRRSECAVLADLDGAERALEAMGESPELVVQQWLPGRREAVSLFLARGRTWAIFAQASHRELPPLGGSSVLYESIPPLPDIVEPAERLVRAIGLEGAAMVEFRRDQLGCPVLMEVNARVAGSTALAIASGVDFPRLLYAWAVGEPLREVGAYRVGKRMRWLAGDLWNLRASLGAGGGPDRPGFLRALGTFLADFVVRPSALDVIELADPRPALAEARHDIVDPVIRRLRRATTRGLRGPKEPLALGAGTEIPRGIMERRFDPASRG